MTASQPVACALTSPELRQRLEHLRTTLFAHTQSVNQDAEGITFEFKNTDTNVDAALNLILLERQCCPFLHFTLDIMPPPGRLALFLGGNDQARAFIDTTFVPLIPQEIQS